MAESAGQQGASLERTPTWAVAVLCAIFITVSILLEHAIHLLSEFFRKRKKKLLNQALYRIKSDLMLMGFISLFLTAAQQPISKICIPKRFEDSFLPCKAAELSSDVVEEASCHQKGKISLVSRKGVSQLQLLVFSLAFFHVVSCLLTLGLGKAKMKRWEPWEEETRSVEYQFSNDPRRFKFTRETTFGRRHLKYWSDHSLLLWPVCFLRQFAGSISKADYFALRRGFIMAHFAQKDNFDFHKFLNRSLDADFVKVVAIRLWIWVVSTLFIFFQAHEFHNYLWLPFIPLMILLVVGTKLEVIITRMCLESSGLAVVSGTLLVKPHNQLFWFGRPQWLLHLIHLVLFQNSFQLAFFTWTWYKFGLRSCFHRQTEDIVIRIAMGILVQLLCGYVTLPLYALVTQMGSSMKTAVFTERVARGLKNWHKRAKQRIIAKLAGSTSPSARLSISYPTEMTPSAAPSPSPTVDTSLSDAHGSEPAVHGTSVDMEIAIADEGMDGSVINPKEPAVHGTSVDMEIAIADEGMDGSMINPKEGYNGEISFKW